MAGLVIRGPFVTRPQIIKQGAGFFVHHPHLFSFLAHAFGLFLILRLSLIDDLPVLFHLKPHFIYFTCHIIPFFLHIGPRLTQLV